MISLEQIKELESRVHTAVARIRSLTAENVTLKERLSTYEQRIDELEKLVNAFKSEQQEIEAGIIAALKQLDGLEDAVAESTAETEEAGSPEDANPTGVGDDEANADDQEQPEVESEEQISDEPEPDRTPEPAGLSAGEREPAIPSATTLQPAESEEEEPELDIF